MGNKAATWRKEALPGVFDRCNGMPEERKRAAEVRDDDVCPLRQLQLARIALDKFRPLREAVRGSNLSREVHDFFRIDGVNLSRPGLACQQRKYSRPAPNFEDYIARPHRLGNGFAICRKAFVIRDHLSVIEERVHVTRLKRKM